MVDVVLVSMPQAAVERPSLALGQLLATLTAAGLSGHVIHANLQYLEFAGPGLIRALDRTRAEDGVADWLFGAAAFPDFAPDPDPDAYLDALLTRNPRLADSLPDARATLRAARARTPAFVDWVADGVLAQGPRIVGCTSTFQQHVAALALLRAIKRRAPDVVTMMGGANCETVMGRTTHRHFPWVDTVVSGEADGLFPALCRLVLAHGADLPAEVLPAGVFAPVHRRIGYPTTAGGDGCPRATTADLRTVPVPDYAPWFAQLGRTLFGDRIRPGLPVEFARGCWWGAKTHCTFCGLNAGGMAFRAKPAAQALAALDTLAARHGVRAFEAVDNIMPLDYLRDLLPHLRAEGRDYRLFYETKANLKPAEVQALAAAGVRWIQPGIESLDTRVLKLLRKGVSAWTNVRLLRLGRQHGVRLSWSILCDAPGEQDSWYAETAAWLPWLSHLQPGGLTRLRYDRYSPYFDDAAAHRLHLKPAPLYRFIYPVPEAVLADLVYYFDDDAADRAARVRRSLLRDAAQDRPGLEAVRRAVVAWTEAWTRPGGPPRLVLRAEPAADGARVVEDTRPAAVAAEHRLDARAVAVLRAAEDGPPARDLPAHPGLAGTDAEAVAATVRDLVDRRLLLPLDGRLVGLVLRAPVPALPDTRDFPGGRLLDGPDRLLTAAE